MPPALQERGLLDTRGEVNPSPYESSLTRPEVRQGEGN
jgi:hypothetical protein